jgi:tRNA(Ile)-lysidine synthase
MMQTSLPKGFLCPFQLAACPPDTPLAVGLSGGADSVALLHMLCSAYKAPITAIHVHHGIRGEEADRDAAFCRTLAERLGVKFALLRLDVPALAKAEKKGLETAAREARYQAIAAYMRANGIRVLATAHHADDQLETLLQNLLRGAGLRGLCGIPACRPLGEATVVRPLLQLQKHALLQYCGDHALSFVTDTTNLEPCCARNRLRLEVLPVLAELWPAGSERAAQAAALLAEDESYLSSLASEFIAREGEAPQVAALCALPAPVLARVLQQLLPFVPEQTHVAALRTLLQKGMPHASLSLPGCTVSIEQGRLCIRQGKPTPSAHFCLPLTKGKHPLPNGGLAVLGDLQAPLPVAPPCKHQAHIAFSSACVKGQLCLRPRERGERILHGGMHKLVRKLSCMTKFTPEERDALPLLCDAEGVLAIPFGPVRDGAAQKADLALHLFFD